MTWRDLPGDETVPVFLRPATRGGAEREKLEITPMGECLECPEWEDTRPSRDAVAVCGTALIIAGAYFGEVGSLVVGGFMAVAGALVLCTAWSKHNDK